MLAVRRKGMGVLALRRRSIRVLAARSRRVGVLAVRERKLVGGFNRDILTLPNTRGKSGRSTATKTEGTQYARLEDVVCKVVFDEFADDARICPLEEELEGQAMALCP